jgi:hypothetical protein
MTASSLQEFVAKAAAKRRITFGDVRRLRRDILPDGLLNRTQTELLLNLDREIPRADGAWTDWLVAAVVDFAVWGERPTGSVEGDAARWLTEVLTRGERLTKAGRRIAREVRREAQTVGEPLASLAPDEEDRPHPVENQLAA